MAMMRLHLTILGAALMSAAGCASTGGPVQTGMQQEHVGIEGVGGSFDFLLTKESFLSSDTLSVPPSRAWPALIQTYAEFGVPLQGADGSRRVIATQYVRAHGNFAGQRLSRWIDCGSSITGDIATSYEITLRFGTMIDSSAAGRSVLRSALGATAQATGGGTTPVECTTRRSFEKQIAALVQSKIH